VEINLGKKLSGNFRALSKTLNKKIKKDSRVDISMLKMADGITLLRKK